MLTSSLSRCVSIRLRTLLSFVLFAVASLALLPILSEPAFAHEGAACVDGMADVYPCSGVDMTHRLHIPELGGSGGTAGSDIWGWTHAGSEREFALVALNDATAFVEVTDPSAPIYLGSLPKASTDTSVWRDVKTYADHAFIVADGVTGHGMQVFDLTQLLSVVSPPVTFVETAHYSGFERAHNIVINEDTGRAFAVGTESGNCNRGLHIIDITTPTSPSFLGCAGMDGYVHDAQCVTYDGPDADYTGRQLCFGFDTDSLTIFDVTDPLDPVQVSRSPYAGTGYTHQGWLTEDHAYLLLGDETDEQSFGHNTKTYIWDLADLEAPTVLDTYFGALPASDHNLYVKDGYVYESNYRSGLRILDASNVAKGELVEVAFFDTFPSSDSVGFAGAWSAYPYFDSGTVVVSDIQGGLFVLQPTALCQDFAGVSNLAASPAGDQQIELSWTDTPGPGETYSIYRSLGACPGGDYELVAENLATPGFLDTDASGGIAYSYDVRKVNQDGCPSLSAGCVDAVTTGACVAPALFGGLGQVTEPPSSACQLHLTWDAAQPNCGSEVTYSVYRASTSEFVPAEGNRVAQGVTSTSWSDAGVLHDQDYFYVVRAVDTSNDVEDANLVEQSGSPAGPAADGSWTTGAEVGDPVLLSDSGNAAGFSKHAGWHLSDVRAHAGTRSYFSEYSNNLCTGISSPPLSLTPGESSELSFWTLWDIEDDTNGTAWDGGVVEISVDGAPWQLLDLKPGYPNVWRSSSDACGYDTGTPAFTGTNLNWTLFTADLSAWVGQSVEIAWRFSTDGAATEEGWYVDDVEISHAQVPGVCNADADVFSDDFESGDVSAWSGSVP